MLRVITGQYDMSREIELFLEAYPSVSMIEALITDCNGVARGKLVPRAKLQSVTKTGLKLPKSALSLDIWGRDIPELAFANGDIDGYCRVVDGSLRPMRTARGLDQGQLLITMYDENQEPFMGDPRQVLASMVRRFNARGLRPCMAAELEFSLLPDPGADKPLSHALRGQASVAGNLYALEELDKHADMLEALREAFEVQGLPYEGIVKEAAPAQFEVNMAHSDEVMVLADHIIRMQRCIRVVAARFNMIASFMPKPMDEHAGNGMHVHCSMLDQQGNNVFNDGTEAGTDLLQKAIAGCLDTMADSMLIFAPSFNAYRRFQAGNHAPTVPTWGMDNRTTAVRIPAGPPQAKRLEHRVAGADANPYLALAAVLAGILHGINDELEPPSAVEGNAWDKEHDVPDLPVLMSSAIEQFEQSDFVAKYLSTEFQTLFSKTKWQELNEFQRRVTEFEVETYLRG